MTQSREPLTEFAMIARYFSEGVQASAAGTLAVGVGDDCAVLSVPAGQRLAISIDTMVAGRHFPVDAAAADIAYRSVATAASDLAAMGAAPLAITLALCLPEADQPWVEQFSVGLHQALSDFQFSLVGGDTTCGPLSISVQVHGLLPQNKALLRSGARVGDRIFVSGCLGDAAAALSLFDHLLAVDQAQADYLRQRFYRPQPRLALGRALLSLASSAIDISDGLIADLGHITVASNVAARIDLESLPLSSVLSGFDDRAQAVAWAVTGGDDYELCFTVSQEHLAAVAKLADLHNVALTDIGEIVAGAGIECFNADDQVVTFPRGGYQHFSEE